MEMIIEQMPVTNIVFKRNVGLYGEGNYDTMKRVKEFAKDQIYLTMIQLYWGFQEIILKQPNLKIVGMMYA